MTGKEYQLRPEIDVIEEDVTKAARETLAEVGQALGRLVADLESQREIARRESAVFISAHLATRDGAAVIEVSEECGSFGHTSIPLSALRYPYDQPENFQSGRADPWHRENGAKDRRAISAALHALADRIAAGPAGLED